MKAVSLTRNNILILFLVELTKSIFNPQEVDHPFWPMYKLEHPTSPTISKSSQLLLTVLLDK